MRKDVEKLDVTETGKELVTAKPTSNYKGHKQKQNNEAIKLCDELNRTKRDCDCDIMSDKEYKNYIENKQELINNYKITYTTKWEIE